MEKKNALADAFCRTIKQLGGNFYKHFSSVCGKKGHTKYATLQTHPNLTLDYVT